MTLRVGRLGTRAPRLSLLALLLLSLGAAPAFAQTAEGVAAEAEHESEGEGPETGGEAESETAVGDVEASLAAEAQALYQAGQAAYDAARYEDALRYFQQAVAIQDLPGLQYNVGLAADRIREDALALQAFERFLETASASHPRRAEVEARVEVLRRVVGPGEEAAPDVANGDDVDIPSPREVAEQDAESAPVLLAEEEESSSRTALIIGVTAGAVALVAAVVVIAVVAGSSTQSPIEGNFGPTVSALR